MRRLAHFFWRFNIYLRWNLYGIGFYRKLKQIRDDDVVIFFSVEAKEPILNIIKWLPAGTRKIIWHWNSFLGKSGYNYSHHKDILLLKGLGIEIATFDYEDSILYNERFIPQFFNFFKSIESKDIFDSIHVDFFFAGIVKDQERKDLIHEIKKYLSNQEYSVDFLTISNDWQGYIAYNEVLSRDARCRCIVDIPRKGQSGLTLRPMESMALQKKLLTTNPYIKSYDFYCADNIFIWGEDDLLNFTTWLKKPYKEIPDTILKQYDTKSWINKIINSDICI